MNKNNLIIYSDGGSRGNPGHSGIGYVIYKNDKIFHQKGEYVGFGTNNAAEYLAVLKSLQFILVNKIAAETLTCHLDSELVVKQLNGEYKIKNTNLKSLSIRINKIIQRLKKLTYKIIIFKHISRNQNELADLMVNKAIDLYLFNLRRSRQENASEEFVDQG